MPHTRLNSRGCGVPSIIPQVGARRAVVDELVAHWLPCHAAVVGTLNQLPEPSGLCRCVKPVGVHTGEPFQVVHLPPGKVRPGNLPTSFVHRRRCQDKRAFLRVPTSKPDWDILCISYNRGTIRKCYFAKEQLWRIILSEHCLSRTHKDSHQNKGRSFEVVKLDDGIRPVFQSTARI